MRLKAFLFCWCKEQDFIIKFIQIPSLLCHIDPGAKKNLTARRKKRWQ
jgi:hypothetical protein